ncbi:MAG: PAS domain-containing protein [Sneathiellaceae bacterium]
MILEEIGFDDIHPLSFRPILDAWFRQKGEAAYPPVSAIDPFIVPSLAPNVILLEVTSDTFAYRVIGDEIRQVVGRDLRNLTIRDFLGDTAYARLIEEQFRRSVEDRVPLYSVHHFRRQRDQLILATRRIIMPYAKDGRASRLLAFQTIDDFPPGQIALPTLDLMSRTVFRVAPPHRPGGSGGPP